MRLFSREIQRDEESGVALLLTVFVLSLATILVVEFGRRARYDLRQSRRFSESIQAQYMLKSTLNLGRVLLELPKPDGITEDWLGAPWALISAAPSLPISGFVGEPRITITDSDGKIDLNTVASRTGPNSTPQQGGSGLVADPTLYWKNSLRNLFLNQGFRREQYPPEQFRTLGNTAYEAGDQVAIIQDWIDNDTQSFSSAAFNGEGIESSAERSWFYNRPLNTLSEILLIPGFTAERLARIAPFVRVSAARGVTARRINVNTAPFEVLQALGFNGSQALEITQERTNLPITQNILRQLTEGDPQLSSATKVTSTEFNIFARVRMATLTKWLKADVVVRGSSNSRRSQVVSLEFY